MEINVVVGASGGLGLAVVRELLILSERVIAIAKNTEKILDTLKMEIPRENLLYLDIIQLDATNYEGLKSACRDATIIYQCANPAYNDLEKQLPKITDNLINICKENSSKLVFADCTFIYGNVLQNPITEAHEVDLNTDYLKIKYECTNKVITASQENQIKATCGRFSKIYGPNVDNDFISPVFLNAINDKKSDWLGDLDKKQSITFVYTIAEALVILGSSDKSNGEVWHLPCGSPITGREFITEIFSELNLPPKIGVIGKGKSRILKRFSSTIRESIEMIREFEQDSVVDFSKFIEAFGTIPIVTHKEGIKQTLSWYQTGYTLDPLEDDLFVE